jgi:hypothetical protein
MIGSFQLAKIRSQSNSSLTRILPLHWDGRRKRRGVDEEREGVYRLK